MTARNILMAGAASIAFSFCQKPYAAPNHTPRLVPTWAQSSSSYIANAERHMMTMIGVEQKNHAIFIKDENGAVSVIQIDSGKQRKNDAAYYCTLVGTSNPNTNKGILGILLGDKEKIVRAKSLSICLSLEEYNEIWSKLERYEDQKVTLSQEPPRQRNMHWSSRSCVDTW